jgi:hypothetical protein
LIPCRRQVLLRLLWTAAVMPPRWLPELLSKVVDDAESQAAIFMPSLKMAPAMTSGSNTLPLSFRHRF